ncbi:hypothetical protein CMU25_18495 [Elizabethkingia anophelis]|nr:hypothetical protein [Elizabethkingia anophelis]MDV3842308.1 hypothetical protein [Elizabethkingia anophelis]
MNQNNEEFNLVVKAVVSIRKIATEITDEKIKISDYHNEIFAQLEEAGKMIVPEKDLATIWIQEKKEITITTSHIESLLNQLFEKLQNRDASELSTLWFKGKNEADTIKNRLHEMEKMGEIIFLDKNLKKWKNIWESVNDFFFKLMDIAETIHLKLVMIEKLEPEEIDELTKDIVKHIPLNYSLQEAKQYKEEYLQAYKELKEEASKKKNLWDKFLDILSGGIQETPAHRVMLRRWMEGDNK